jgi:DNA-directed RNA polymerase subunit H (RpoH/RPB5)
VKQPLQQTKRGDNPYKNHTRRNFVPEVNQVIHEEVEKLLHANFIREVDYPEWLANAVLVKKSSGDNPYKRNT